MRRRGLVGVLAAVLAILGAVLIVNYVRGADARAMANQELTQVVVVTRDIPMGTLGKDLGTSVTLKQLPRAAVAEGALTDMAQIPATSAVSATLKPGEQVLKARFVAPDSDEITAVEPLPEGMQQLSIELEPQRVVGSKLKPGDLVGVYMSMKVKDINDNTKPEIPVTNEIAHKVKVLRAQGGVPQARPTADANPGEKTPSSVVIVTLAVDSELAEKIIFGQEFGKLWLTQETDKSKTDDTQITHTGNVYPRQITEIALPK